MELASDLDTVMLQLPGLLCFGINDGDKLWLEGGSTHKETINILLGGKFLTGSTGHRTSINDPHRIGHIL